MMQRQNTLAPDEETVKAESPAPTPPSTPPAPADLPVLCTSDCTDGEGDINCHFNFKRIVYVGLSLIVSGILALITMMMQK